MAKAKRGKPQIRVTATGIQVRYGARTGLREKRGRVPVRWSAARGAFYVPMKHRTGAAQRAATRYDAVACSAGAMAAMLRGYRATPKGSCGPRGMFDPRAHRLLAYWRHASMGEFRRNPGCPCVVWQPNPEPKGGRVEWALIDAKGRVLTHGTVSAPQQAVDMAMRRLGKYLNKRKKR
jgi:hypothetical protein